MTNIKNCLICGKKLKYFSRSIKVKCELCKKSYETLVTCEDGHYICDKCHQQDANEFIEKISINTKIKDPIELTLEIFKNKKIKLHGPEHHFLVPAVLLSSYYNTKGEFNKKEGKIKEARKRAEKILGGFCGSHGVCGAAIGNGTFISLITNATPLSEDEWKLSNQITARTLEKISDIGGPRCCKRNTIIAILTALDFIKEKFNLEIKTNKKYKCSYSNLNQECIKQRCPYYIKN